MKIELKNVKYVAFNSQETHCFEATVYINGVRRCTVRNAGHGGSNEWSDWKVADEINAYGATLPKIVCDFNDRHTGKPFEMTEDAETLIGDLMNEWLHTREFKKIMSKGIVWIGDDNEIYTINVKNPEHLKRHIQNPLLKAELQKKNNNVKHLLSQMSFEDGLKAYKEAYKAALAPANDQTEGRPAPKP